VVPLRPEFIRPQDGQAKQDCEINAAKRWLAAHAAQYSTGCQRRRQRETNRTVMNGSGAMVGDGDENGPADRSTGPCRS
jgi:hypothetical protein